MQRRHTTPPRPLLIVDSSATIVFANRAFSLMGQALRRWHNGDFHPPETVVGKALDSVCTLYSSLPQLASSEVDRRSIAATYGSMACRLGVRGVQWSGDGARVVYWRRLDSESSLRDWLLRAAMTLLPALQDIESSAYTAVPAYRKVQRIMGLLFDIARQPTAKGLRKFDPIVGEKVFEFADALSSLWRQHSPERVDLAKACLDELLVALQNLHRATEQATDELEYACNMAHDIGSFAAQTQLLQKLARLQITISNDQSKGSDSLLQGVQRFADKGSRAAEDIQRFSTINLQGQQLSQVRLSQTLSLGEALQLELVSAA